MFLELALVRWVLEVLRGHGFEPVIPPVLVKEEALFGTGFLPDTEQQIYRLADDPLYLTGTSEVPLASLHAGEIMDDVPRRYAGFSPCFRREAGAAGKDTRGIFRVHQFDKVEMFAFVEPQRLGGRARAAAGDRGGDPPGPRDPVPRGQHRGRRPRLLGGQEVRPRGLAAVAAALPRAHLDLEHDRLPVAPAGHPLSAGRRQARARPHAERHRGGGRPHADRADGEPPDRRRRRRGPEVLRKWGAPERLG